MGRSISPRRVIGTKSRALAAAGLVGVAAAGCGRAAAPPATRIPSALIAEARPIGRGARFHPPVRGPVSGRCQRRLGPRNGVHVEVFAADRVVLLATGISTRPPYVFSSGRISAARCYGALVTLDPTGLVLVRRGMRLSLGQLFHAWGQPLTQRRLASFSATAGTTVSVFVDGHRWRGAPADVPLRRHDEIVLEVGPHVPPHTSYTFPAGV
jgi:hypothetical protein